MHAHLILQPEVQVQVRARMMLDMLLHAIVFMSHVQSCSQAHSRGQQLVADMQPDPLTERQEAELLEHPIQDQDVQQRLGRASFKTFMFTSMLLPLLFLVLAAWVKANAPSISALGVDQVPGLEEAEDTSPLGISDWARKQLIADMRRELAGVDAVAVSSGRQLIAAEAKIARIVLLPDLHGDFDQALHALRLAHVVGSHGQWSANSTVLVQLGDIVDRGPSSLLLLAYFERLKAQALAAGGDVVTLLGNHELMNIMHDYRYVSRAELAWLSELDTSTAVKQSPGLQPQQELSATLEPEQAPGPEVVQPSQEVMEALEEALSKALEDRLQASSTTQGLHADSGAAVHKAVGQAMQGMGRALEPQQKQKHPHEQLVQGLERWVALLAPHAKWGKLLRQRRIAYLVGAADGGGNTASGDTASVHGGHGGGGGSGHGCRVLAVHAAAAPGLLAAAGMLLRERGDPAVHASEGQQHAGRKGSGASGSKGRPVQPEEYLKVWNYAVQQALQSCGTWPCPAAASGRLEPGVDMMAGLLLGSKGAVWSRRYSEMPQRHVCAEVAQVADLLGVTAIIVGHTITPSGRVEMKCDGRLVMADVGLSAWTMGKMGVLVCEGGQMHALHGEDDYHTV